MTWEEAARVQDKLSYGLLALGVQPGDRVAILSQTRWEWSIADTAIFSFGGVTVGLYPTDTAQQIEYILRHSEAKVLFVDGEEQLQKVLTVRQNLPHLQQIVLFDDSFQADGKTILNFEDLQKRGEKTAAEEPDRLDRLRDQVQPEDVATLIYTSGTTGPPKGAILTHENFYSVIEAALKVLPLRSTDSSLVFMPLCHVYQRVVAYTGIYVGAMGIYVERIDQVAPMLRESHPTLMASVPRIYEKAYARITSQVNAANRRRQAIFRWACRVGEERSRCIQAHRSVPLWVRLQYGVATLLVFRKIRAALGGRIRFMVSGGAPISLKILQFFHAAGILVLEGYGLTETTAFSTTNRVDDYKLGTVGKPAPGVEIRIAEDGEILIRGRSLFKGYFKDPEKTAEAIDAEGWFHSGDIGEFDEEGYLKITDRKKDLIVTAGGKNIAPQNIENLIKGHPLISQVMVHGDKRNYLTALITIDPEEAKIFASECGFRFSTMEEFVGRPEVQTFIQARIDEKNRELARYEQIKKFRILPQDFTIEDGTLTPTQKVKRRVAAQRFKEILDQMYEEIYD